MLVPRLTCLTASMLVLGACATESQRPNSLKVTRAVLYQNGIGYFERRGRLDDDVLRLRVRPDQIRDVLKSLTVVDLHQGRAISVGLPIEKSRAQQLSDLPEQVRAVGGVLAVAQAFRGARCTVEANGTATGRLVGVENLSGADGKPDWRITVLVDGGALKQFKVTEVRSLRLLDGTLEIGLRKALDAALDAGTWKPVEVTVRLAGHVPHDLVVSYVVEMPRWKPAYRIVTGADKKSLLQGWAVVDNVSGDDWKGVRLSLTAGTPLAFTYDLYTPRFTPRPNLQPHDESAQIPLDAYNAESGIPADEEKQQIPMPAPAPAATASATPAMKLGAKKRSAPRSNKATNEVADAPSPSESPISTEQMQGQFRALVAGTTMGSLFRYDLEEPITINDRQSALVNIVNTRLPGEEVLLFRVGADSGAPYRAVRFSNDSGLVLESGPVAIYRQDEQGGTFLGESLTKRIEKGAISFIPYALDGRVRVTLSESVDDEVASLVRIVHGEITAESRLVTRFSYDVDNGSGEASTLYIRRERRPGWDLVTKDKAIEEGGAYYIPIALAKTGRVKVVVAEQSRSQRQIDIFDGNGPKVLALFLSNASADPALAAQLRDVLKIRERIGTIEDQGRTLEQQRDTQAERESEVRENIKALGKASSNADLKRKLEATLIELEKGLNDVTRRLVTLNIERGELRDRLASLMKEISFERH